MSFWNFFFEYAMICVWFQKKKTLNKKNNKDFDKRFKTVQIRLLNKQLDDTLRYFDLYVDIFTWTNVNYAAKFLYKLRYYVIHSTNEMFYRKHISKNEMNSLIWNLWKHVEYNETSSKRSQKNKKFERVLRQASMNFLTNIITTKSIRNVDKSKLIFRFSITLITSTSKNVVKSIEIELNFFIKSNEI